ncbi:hypothetical protein J1614_001148 [Plenodomus biglobosus]|nr:hypothetical protein J1614_001148 [Plenodomus biglobosus]
MGICAPMYGAGAAAGAICEDDLLDQVGPGEPSMPRVSTINPCHCNQRNVRQLIGVPKFRSSQYSSLLWNVAWRPQSSVCCTFSNSGSSTQIALQANKVGTALWYPCCLNFLSQPITTTIVWLWHHYEQAEFSGYFIFNVDIPRFGGSNDKFELLCQSDSESAIELLAMRK